MDVPTHEEVIAGIEAFLVRHDMAQTRLGSEATGDPNLVNDLRKGRSPRLAKLLKLQQFMAGRDAELQGNDDEAGFHAPGDTAASVTPSAGNETAASPREASHA